MSGESPRLGSFGGAFAGLGILFGTWRGLVVSTGRPFFNFGASGTPVRSPWLQLDIF